MNVGAVGNLTGNQVDMAVGENTVVKNDGVGKFQDMFKNALDEVNDMQIQSDKLTDDFASGKTDDIHNVMITAEKANISLQFALQVRNKALDAYNEIMRMQF